MSDLHSPRLMYLKAGLFVGIGLIAAALLFMENPSVKVAALLCLCVWGFARAYYFAFYVVQHYIDLEYRFAGLRTLFVYLMRKRKAARGRRQNSRCA